MKGNLQRDRLLIIYLCFFVSGVAGLIYEILWNKYLALFIGSTGRAHVMTLAVFMGGLAMGSAVFGRRADRMRNPLRLYILLELMIGLWGVAYPFLFEPYRRGFIALAQGLGLESSSLMGAKLLFCALTILVPTFLMGGTLPVLGRYLVSRLSDLGPRVATLYYVNTFGAFVGCLLAGFVMIPTYGLRRAMMMAAILNFAVCLLASLLFQKKYAELSAAPVTAAPAGARTNEAPDATADAFLYPRSIRIVVLATVGLSGFVSMAYEVAWIRLLTLVIGSSTYSFSLMVATFIFGIGLGSFLLSFKRSERGYDVIYGLAELGLGLSVLALLPLVERVPFWFNRLVSLFVRESYAFGLYMFVQMLICFLLMLVPTVLLGMTLPAATRIVTLRAGHVGSRVGSVYALNTLGTLLGASVAGLIFLPVIGLKHTFEVGIVLNLLIGLAVIWFLPGGGIRVFRPLATVGCVALFAAYLIFVPAWDQNILSSGIFRQRGRLSSFQALRDMLANREGIPYYKDGVDASIAVVDAEGTRSLLINGKADASDSGDMSTQILISHYPLLTRPDSKQVLVIGMGSGVSVGSALQYPVEQVDAVEISKEVVEAATTLFTEANFEFHKDKRVAIHTEDAKTFLLLTPTRYDVIISEPTNPWIAGVAGLFSTEFFRTCIDHLERDGLFLQWIHVYETDDAALMSVLRTFTAAFPHVVIWNMNRYDIAIMGSPSPFEPDFAWMEEQMERPGIRRDLARLGIEHLQALLSTQMFASTTRTTQLASNAVENSDFHPFLEYSAPIGFFAGSYALGIRSFDRREQPRPGRRLWIDDYRPTTPPTSLQYGAFYRESGKTGSLFCNHLADWTDRWRAACPDDPQAVRAWIESRTERLQWQREQLKRAVERFPDDGPLSETYAGVVVQTIRQHGVDTDADFAEARTAIARAEAFHPKSRWPYARLLIEIAYREGKMDEVLKLGPQVLPHLSAITIEEGVDAPVNLLRMICEAAIACGKRDFALLCVLKLREFLSREGKDQRHEMLLLEIERRVSQMPNPSQDASP